jgi:dTMP kinase
MDQGFFIVLEGVDGSGTTSQSHYLANSLKQRGNTVHVTAEPSDGPIGMLLRQILRGRVVVPDKDGSRFPSWNTMALMFAADRLDHLEAEIEPVLREGATVICDRYYHSSLAYQSATAQAPDSAIEWIRQINQQARRPDLTIILDVPFDVARQRRRSRVDREIYEDDSLQKKLCVIYREIEKNLNDERIVHIDATTSFERVAQDVFDRVIELYDR